MSECVFEQFNECGLKEDSLIEVEMNVGVDGKFHAHQNHPEFEHSGPHINAERVAGKAHLSCYKNWYEETYKTPFTMSG